MPVKIKEILIVVFLIAVVLFTIQCHNINRLKTQFSDNYEPENADVKVTKSEISKEYNIIRKKIKPGQSFASILDKINNNSYKNEEIIQEAAKIFDLRTIKAGNYINAYLSADSANDLAYIIYEHSITETLKISLIDSIKIEHLQKKLDTVQRFVAGEIETSLWEAMVNSGTNPNLAVELSDIYAWTIDFFGLSKGDEFKVLYDELLIDSVSVGIGRIYAAYFINNNKGYYAFSFNQDGKESYYDENGKNLKKEFLKAPLKYRRISSKFSYSRRHPVLKIYRPHRGVDYAAPAGTPVVSIGEGKVVGKGFTKAAGYYIKIKHNGTYTSGYNHFSRYAKGMYIGAQVKQGQVIGYVGSTGYATGPHLDFRIWKNGQLTDPLKIKAPPVEPIKEENEVAFYKIRNLMTLLLDRI